MIEKEYLNILNQIALNYDAEYVNECHDDFCISMRNNIKQLENLIKEHFDNQPLKFEDLKPNMWVWDKDFNGWGEFLRIVEICVNKYGEKLVKCLASGDSSLQTRSYKENRFYRKQVQDE